MQEGILEFWQAQESLAAAEEKLWADCTRAVAERNPERLGRLVRELGRLMEWKRQRSERERNNPSKLKEGISTPHSVNAASDTAKDQCGGAG